MLGVLAPDLTAAADRKARTAASLRGLQAVVGPAVGPEQLPEAMRVTRLAVRLRAEGHLAGDPVFVADHLDALVVHRDARLLAALRSRVLGPLDAAPVETRERLVETLACWLRHFGEIAAVAEELHVHRQTVRYRLRQLREFLGDALDTPDRRLQLVLVLGW
jgi:DNA-binding PucR family transcriptional regulator